MKIIIYNKIPGALDNFKRKSGVSKTFFAENKLGTTRQSMYKLAVSENLSLETLIKFSYICNCEINELYSYEIIDDGKTEWSKEVR